MPLQPTQAPVSHVMCDTHPLRGEETRQEDRVPAAYEDEIEEESDEGLDFKEYHPFSL